MVERSLPIRDPITRATMMPVVLIVRSPSQSFAFGQYGMNGAYAQADPMFGVNGDPWIQHGTSVRSSPGF